MKFVSPRITTINSRENKCAPSTPVVDDTLLYMKLQPKEVIPHVRIFNIIKYIREHFPDSDSAAYSECVGFKLLGIRTNASDNLYDVLDQESKNGLEKLFTLGNLPVRQPRLRTRNNNPDMEVDG